MSEDGPVNLTVCVDIEGGTRLLKQRPEKHLNRDQEQGCKYPVPRMRLQCHHGGRDDIEIDERESYIERPFDDIYVLNE